MAQTKSLSEEEIENWRKKFQSLSNSGRYAEAYRLASKLKKKHPDVLVFAYYEAVMTAEATVGFTPSQLNARYKKAAKKFQALLRRVRHWPLKKRFGFHNEYYWFSKQPLKQYRLGQEGVAKGLKRAYYSQGVGASQLALRHALAGRKKLCLQWAVKSEKAWLKYFEVVPDWYNSYLFYASALGYQGRTKDMDKALAKAAKIAGRPKNWKITREYRKEILKARGRLEV